MNLPHEKSWWDRNWKWFVPVLCVGCLVALACLILGILTLVFGVMRSSDVYEEAVATAKANPMVEAALGTPIEEGLLMTGSINVSGSSGDADLAIPIYGPRRRATIYAVASKSRGEWVFSSLTVGLKDGEERIDLLE